MEYVSFLHQEAESFVSIDPLYLVTLTLRLVQGAIERHRPHRKTPFPTLDQGLGEETTYRRPPKHSPTPLFAALPYLGKLYVYPHIHKHMDT